MKNYPKIEDDKHVAYVKSPVQRKNGKWICADVIENGFLDLPNYVEHDTEESAQAACNTHNKWHGWTTKEVLKIISWSMGLGQEGKQKEISEALEIVTTGKKDVTVIYNGSDAFIGCLERFEELKKEKGKLAKEDTALFCKQESDNWYEGFDDDSTVNRNNFAASLFHRIESCSEK